MAVRKYSDRAAKQRAYRQRKDPVRGTVSRIRRFLTLHPDQVQSVDTFMVTLAAKVQKAAQRAALDSSCGNPA